MEVFLCFVGADLSLTVCLDHANRQYKYFAKLRNPKQEKDLRNALKKKNKKKLTTKSSVLEFNGQLNHLAL